MNANAELLNFVYQNSQMGIETLGQLIEVVEDKEFQGELEKQKGKYQEFHKKAQEMLNANGYDEKGIGTLNKISAYIMVNMRTLTDKSASHIAEMLMSGSNMGITNAIKDIKKYEKDVEKDILSLMKDLLNFEEENVETFKKYL